MKDVSITGLRVLALTAVMVIAGTSAGGAADEARLSATRMMTLYPAPRLHGSYSLYYDICLESPGLVSIGVEVLGSEPGGDDAGRLLSVSLRRRGSQIELRNVILGPDGGTFSYGVDAYELELSRGEYRIEVSNWSLERTMDIRLGVLYPGAAGQEKDTKIIMLPGFSI